jgi:hypothetical protein
MGRRVFYKEEVNGEMVAHHKFVYYNYRHDNPMFKMAIQ